MGAYARRRAGVPNRASGALGGRVASRPVGAARSRVSWLAGPPGCHIALHGGFPPLFSREKWGLLSVFSSSAMP